MTNETRLIVRKAVLSLARSRRAFQKPDSQTLPILTRREVEVLALMTEGLTNNEIAQKLFSSSTTVDTHRKNLLSKFVTKILPHSFVWPPKCSSYISCTCML